MVQSCSVPDSVVTIGNFDGVHLGHQQIIRSTLERARAAGQRAIALTFRPHPQAVLFPERAPPLLLAYDEKRAALLEMGLDDVVEQPFDRTFAATDPEDFFRNFLQARLGVRSIVVGYDFTFGKERTGHLQLLGRLCDAAGVSLSVISPQRVNSEVVSSSLIRANLAAGRLVEARSGMGRPFFYRGTVITGDQRGRKIGFPTANMALRTGVGEKLILPLGVYATRLTLEGRTWPAVTNVGRRPTFVSDGQNAPVLVETHVLDESPDLYSKTIQVDFFERIRGEQQFAGATDLQNQIRSDILRARQILVSI